MKLSQMKATELPQSVFLYGAAKTGKTYLAGQLAEQGYNLFWIDLEKGIRTLQNSLSPEAQERITYLALPDTPLNPVAVATIGKLFAARTPLHICHEHGKVACAVKECKQPEAFTVFDPSKLDSTWVVVIDSMTQLSDSAGFHASQAMQATLIDKAAKMGFDEYGYQGMLLKSILSNMQQANFHRLFIGHEDIVEQTDGKDTIFPVCGTRAFSRQAARYFDHVAYLFRQNGAHKAASSTSYRANIMTGSRSAVSLETGAQLSDLLRGTGTVAAKEAVPAGAAMTAAQKLAQKMKANASAVPTTGDKPAN